MTAISPLSRAGLAVPSLQQIALCVTGRALWVRGAIARMFEATVGHRRPARPEPWYPEIFDVTGSRSTAESSLIEGYNAPL